MKTRVPVASPRARPLVPAGKPVATGAAPTAARSATAVPPVTAVPASHAAIPALAPGERLAEPAAVIPSVVHEAAREPGRPLEDTTRRRFEPGLAADLGAVRIHTGDAAARAAAALDARAFTVGRDVLFGAGEYQPGTDEGRHLIAHELTHTAQAQPASGRAVSRSGDASEREADAAADELLAHRPAAVHTPAAAVIQRAPVTGSGRNDPPHVGDALLDHASPLLAAAAGSTTVDGFGTGKSDLEPGQRAILAVTAHNIVQLLEQYPQATVDVIGHTDTVGTEAHNLDLGRLRATTVMAALAALGVPRDVIETQSAGESAPLAVATRDETPNAKNRRVEVRFDPKSSLPGALRPTAPILPMPGASDQGSGPGRPPINLTVPPDYNFGRPEQQHDPSINWRDDYFKPLPPAPKGTRPQSALDVIVHAVVDPVIDQVTKPLPAKARDFIKNAAHDAVKSGIAKAARIAAENAGVKDPAALDAIEKATEAAIQEKGSAP